MLVEKAHIFRKALARTREALRLKWAIRQIVKFF